MRILILAAAFIIGAAASVPVRDACGEDAAIVADIQPADPIQVRHALIGESIPCYAVSVTKAGQEIRGFVLGDTLPAVQQFERRRALETRLAIPAPPPLTPGERGAAPLSTGPPFAPWRGVSTRGQQTEIDPAASKATLVSFWDCESKAARRSAQELMKTESEFKAKGLKAFGFVEANNAGRAGYYLDDMSLDYPQVLDQQRLAAKYGADPNKGTTLVIDASNNIVTVSSNPAEIRAAVAKLLSPE
jgi:hypothetical protein